MTTWKLQDAKVQFSYIVKLALETGPQFITKRGQSAVVVLSHAEYEALIQKSRKNKQ